MNWINYHNDYHVESTINTVLGMSIIIITVGAVQLADHDGNVVSVVKWQRAVVVHQVVVCSLEAVKVLRMVCHHAHYMIY